MQKSRPLEPQICSSNGARLVSVQRATYWAARTYFMMLEVRTEVRRPLRFFRMRVENKPYLQLKRQELIKRVSLYF